MKILIADDHSVVRKGLKQVLIDLNIFSTIEEAQDGYEALEKIKKIPYDFVILDISMPGLSGLDILQELKILGIKRNILVLSVHPQSQYAIRALRMGANGYLSKDSAFNEIELAIQKTLAGQKYISSEIAEELVFKVLDHSETQLHETLSEREFQVMCLLSKGISVMEIGKKLNISDNTVSTHRIRILGKMGMTKNAELTLYAAKNGLIE